MSLRLETSPNLAGVTTALGGGPILLHEGQASNWEHRPQRHPRTAIGWNREHLFLVVVDGRQKGLSIGMNYTELSALMVRLGCTEAMNLDGGGSSTLWLGGRVMNSPSDGRQRRVANSLIIVSTEPEERP
jgi:exopolysaccharide biosynthesis protein